jgi:hypothetical protein
MLTFFVWPPLLSSTTTSTSLTPQCLVAAAISFWEPTAAFLGKYSSPLLCFANHEIVQLQKLSEI